MWGGLPPGQRHAGIPDSEEDAWRIGYEGGSQEAQEPAPAPARGGRPRYAPTADSQRWGQQQQQQQQQQRAQAPQSPTLSAGSPGAGSAAHPTLGEELQTVLHALTQHPGMQQQQQPRPALQSEWGALRQPAGAAAPSAQVPQRRSGQRQMLTISPAIPADQALPEAAARVSGGRRWRQAQAAAAGGPQEQQQLHVGPGPMEAPGSSSGGGGGPAGDDFFAVDADLVQAAQRQAAAAQQAKPRRQARTKQWDSPQAPAPSQLPLAASAAGAEHTPLPSQRANPLAALLGGGGGGSSSAKPRAATTGGRLRGWGRGQHPLHSQIPALEMASPAGSSRPAASAAWGGGGGGGDSIVAGGSSSSAIREALGLRAPPLTSPRQQQAQPRRPQHPPHQHSRFAIREPAAAADDSAAAAQAGAGLQALMGEPRLTAHKQRFQPRPKRPEAPREGIEDEEGEGAAAQGGGAAGWQQPPPQQQQWQQQQQQQPWQGDGPPAADSFRTPGQPIRHRSWQDGPELQQQQQAPGTGGGPPPSTGGSGAPGSSGSKGGAMSLQRSFIAQLQPISRPAAAASLQQQKQRLAGTAGLHARMQAILAAERAAAECAPSPAAGAGPRLTVLDKQLEGSLTKCLCRCDATAASALGAPQVVALLQNRTAREVDTAPGSVLLLREPWRVLQVPDSPHPVVLCWSAVGG